MTEIRGTCPDFVGETHRDLEIEGESLMTEWEEFKTLIKSYFYPIRYIEDQWIWWHYFRERLGQSV